MFRAILGDGLHDSVVRKRQDRQRNAGTSCEGFEVALYSIFAEVVAVKDIETEAFLSTAYLPAKFEAVLVAGK